MPAVLTYKLKRACGNTRPWSMQCTNSFAIDQCGPLDCVRTPPSTICVKPVAIPVYECTTIGCPLTVIHLANFQFDESNFDNWDLLSYFPDFAAINAFYGGDYLLRNSLEQPCVWTADLPTKWFYDIPGLWPCSLPAADEELSGRIAVIITPSPFTPAAGFWVQLQVAVGVSRFASVANICYEEGESIGELNFFVHRAGDGSLTIPGGGTDPLDQVIFKETLDCGSVIDIPVWPGVILPASLELLEGS